MSTILVTGGAGYIGSHICKALSLAGHTPVVFDNLSSGHQWAVRWGPLVVGDIRDRDAVRAALAPHAIEAVIHLAARSFVDESMRDPAGYWDNNVVGSHVLLEAMRERQNRRLIFSSTCATYGRPEIMPVTEATPQAPISPYGTTKLAVEHMIADYARSYGFRHAVFRYFNAAGADPDGQIGEVHDPEPHLIPNILAVASGEKTHIEIFGDDYDTPDGTCIRDYIHVTDIASAHVLALNALLGDGKSIACNLGSNIGSSVMDIVKAARRITGVDIPYKVAPRRAGDPPVIMASSALAEKQLGWRCRNSDLDRMISTAWTWTRAHHASRTPEAASQA